MIRNICYLAFLIGLCVFSPLSASACFGADSYALSPAEQVSKSTDIFVAKFAGYEELELDDMEVLPDLSIELATSLGLKKATFEVRQVIKGSSVENVTLKGVLASSPKNAFTVTHDSLEFWYAGRANGELDSTCGYTYSLEIGQNYLVSKRGEAISAYSAELLTDRSNFFYLLAKGLLSPKEIMGELLIGNIYQLGHCNAINASEIIEIIRSANQDICDEDSVALVAIFERENEGGRFFLEVYESRKTWNGKVKLHNPRRVFDEDERSSLPSAITLEKTSLN